MAKLSILDTAFLALETEASPKHVAGLAIFEPVGKSPDLRELIADMKSVPAEEPFNQKLNPSLATLPSWVEDADFDLDWHVRHVALPKPGDIKDLMEYVARVHSTLLDRPLVGVAQEGRWPRSGVSVRRDLKARHRHHVRQPASRRPNRFLPGLPSVAGRAWQEGNPRDDTACESLVSFISPGG